MLDALKSYATTPQFPTQETELEHPAILLPLVNGLTTRGIEADTCKLYECYGNGEPGVMVAKFPHGYKFRRGGWTLEQGKKETWWAPGSKRELFGLHLWGGESCDVYLCEGETDAMAMYQATLRLCLAVSGKPSPELWAEWLETIAKICGESGTLYLCFDADAEGDNYAAYVSKHYPHKKKSLVLPTGFKDVCEWLLEVGTPTLWAWEDLPKLPAYVKSAQTVSDSLRLGGLGEVQPLSSGFPRLDYLGLQYYPLSFVVLTAGSKAGKSSLLNQLVINYIQKHNERVLFLPMEMSVEQTQACLGASILGVETHSRTQQELCDVAASTLGDKLLWIDRGGGVTTEDLETWYQMMEAMGIKLLVIDPLQASIAIGEADADHATLSIDKFMYKIQELNKQYRVSCLAVSHSNDATAEARINANQLRGSRTLIQVPSAIFGVQRTDDGCATVYSVSPDRMYGRKGEVPMVYESGRFAEVNTKRSNML